MSEPIVTQEVALSFIRTLSGAPGYPFHAEGEGRAAQVLRECTLSVSHARAVVDEFETDFPTLEQIRSVAFRLRENFGGKKPDPVPTHQQLEEAWRGLKDKLAVPEIPGRRWEVSLVVQCIRIALGQCGGVSGRESLPEYERDFPEAVKALRAGREPDYALVEMKLATLIPTWSSVKVPLAR